MIATDDEYREMLCCRLIDLIEECRCEIHKDTLKEIDAWLIAFVKSSGDMAWDVDTDRLDEGATDLLIDLLRSFKSSWQQAMKNLGLFIYAHKVFRWDEHRLVKTIISDIENILRVLRIQKI